MSDAQSIKAELQQREEEELDQWYELREELEIVAEADVRWSKYARNILQDLREAGYDV